MKQKSAKEIICESLIELSAKKPLHKLTVKNIASHAEVSTVTFYKYFSSKEELFQYVTMNYGQSLFVNLSETYPYSSYLIDVMNNNRFMRESVMNTYRNPEQYYEQIEILKKNQEKLLTDYIEAHEGKAALTDTLLTAIDLFLYGMVHILLNDVLSGMKENPEKLNHYRDNNNDSLQLYCLTYVLLP